MGNYNLIDVLLLLGIAQGLFLAITIPIVHQKNVAANKVLTLQLLLACLALLTRIALYKISELWIIQRLAPLEFLIFIFGPLGYIYLKRLLEQERSRFLVSWVHYIPALVYLAFLIHLNTYSTRAFHQRLVSGYFAIPFFVAELAAMLFNSYYWFLSMRFFIQIQKKKKEQFSFRQPAISFVRILLIASGIILLAWTISFISTYILRIRIPIINYNLVWIAIPLLIYAIGFFALKQPEIFRILLKEKSKAKFRELIDQQSIDSLKTQLTKLMNRTRST